MDSSCFYEEFVIPISRNQAFKAIVINGHNLITKLLPHAIKAAEFTHGDGGPGSIKRIIFTEGSGLPTGELLYRVDTFDPENCTYKTTLIKGGMLSDTLDSVVYETQYLALGPDKCMVKKAVEYHPKEGVKLKEEDINRDRHATIGFYKTIVAHLLANRDFYA